MHNAMHTHAVHLSAGSVSRATRYAPRGTHARDAPLRVASATSSACGPSTSTSTRRANRVVDVSHALDRRVEEPTASRRARVALASTIAAGVLALSPLSPVAAAPAFAEPAAVEAPAAPAAAAAEPPAVPSAASTSPDAGDAADKLSENAGAGAPSGAYPLSASAPLPSEVKAAEKASEKSSGSRGGGGDAGGEEKPKSKQEKSAGRLKELNDLRLELDLKELEVRQKSQELLRQEQTTAVLKEELELARRLNTILKSELDSAKEESKLSMGLCAQVGTF